MTKLLDFFFVLVNKLRNLFLRWWVSHQRGIELGRNILFVGTPRIEIRNGGRIIIGNDVLINSSNRGYHINMHSPVKLFADLPGSKIIIGEQSRIHGSCLHAYSLIQVGRRCLIAANCQIMDGSGHDLSFENVENRINTRGEARPIIIEDCVWIGANTIVLPGVRIGRGSVISAGSIVVNNIPPMTVAAGNPAKVIIKYKNGKTVCETSLAD